MNDTFDIKRFGLVFKKLIFEKSVNLAGSFVLIALVTWLVYHLNGDMSEGWRMAQIAAFLPSLIFGGVYWVSIGFNHFSDKAEGYGFMTLPASHLEKWLSVVVLTGVFALTYCLFFRAMDTAYTNYFRTHLNLNLKEYKILFDTAIVLPFWGHAKGIMNQDLVYFSVTTGIMAIGSLYFNKTALVKTMFIFAGIIFLLEIFNSNSVSILFNQEATSSFHWDNVHIQSINKTIDLPKNINQIFTLFFSFLLPTILWLIALVRLREKEL